MEELFITDYGGKELPIWLGNPLILINVARIKLSGCTNCLALPALWKLPQLKWLKIDGMEKVEYMMQSCSYTDKGFESLEELEISKLPNLKELPAWMGNPLFLQIVVSIEFYGCTNCLVLPAFWQLPLLKKLTISRMEKIEYMMMIQNGNNNLVTGVRALVDATSNTNATSIIEGFPSLVFLGIYDLPNLKGLLMPMDDDDHRKEEGRENQHLLLLPRLKMLNVDGYPQLTLPILPAIEILGVRNIVNVNLLNRISKLTTLNEDLVSLPDDMFQNLTRLRKLSIWAFRKLKTLPANMSSLAALTKFDINHCDELESGEDLHRDWWGL